MSRDVDEPLLTAAVCRWVGLVAAQAQPGRVVHVGTLDEADGLLFGLLGAWPDADWRSELDRGCWHRAATSLWSALRALRDGRVLTCADQLEDTAAWLVSSGQSADVSVVLVADSYGVPTSSGDCYARVCAALQAAGLLADG